MKIIPAKFGQNPASSFGAVLWGNLGRRTAMDDAHHTTDDQNSSPWAFGSGELKLDRVKQ